MPPAVAVVVPCLGLPDRLEGLLAALPEGVDVWVVDDGSAPPLSPSRGRLLRHERTRGYGAAQKAGYAAALAAGAERVVLLHGDGQYDPVDVLGLAGALDEADAAFGSRFLGTDRPRVPAWRRTGIHALTLAANLRFSTRHSDLHNGARAFRAEVLAALPLGDFPDGYLFDHAVVVALLAAGRRIAERPVRMTYGPGVLSIRPADAVRYGLGCLAMLAR